MFNLTSNEYVEKGICKYADGMGNTAFMRRDGPTRFTAKLRFSDKRIKMTPVQIDAYTKDEGVSIKLDYPIDDDVDEVEINDRVGDFGKLLQHWIDLVQATTYIGADDSELIKYSAEETKQLDLIDTKCNLLAQFEELAPLAGVLAE